MPRSRIVFRHSHSQFRFHFVSYPLFPSFPRLFSSRPTFHLIFHSFILQNFLATSNLCLYLFPPRPPIEMVYSEQQSIGFVATSFLVSRFDDLSRDASGAKPAFLLLHGVQHRSTPTTQPTRYVVNNKRDPMCREWAWIETHGPLTLSLLDQRRYCKPDPEPISVIRIARDIFPRAASRNCARKSRLDKRGPVRSRNVSEIVLPDFSLTLDAGSRFHPSFLHFFH